MYVAEAWAGAPALVVGKLVMEDAPEQVREWHSRGEFRHEVLSSTQTHRITTVMRTVLAVVGVAPPGMFRGRWWSLLTAKRFLLVQVQKVSMELTGG